MSVSVLDGVACSLFVLCLVSVMIVENIGF